MMSILLSVLLAVSTEGTDLNQGLMHSKSASRYEVDKQDIQAEDTFSFFGKLRTAYIYRDDHLNGHKTNYATAIGGQFGIDTRDYKGFNLHAAAYTSLKINPLTGDGEHENKEFFDKDGNSYVYLGEASLEYKAEGFEGMIGRIRIDTPYADSDDSRMSPNTFEGAWAYQAFNEELSAQVFYLSRMAGLDSAGSQDEFDDIYDGDAFGLVGVSFDYHYDGNNDISLWYYYVDKMSHIIYTEMNYERDFSKGIHLNLALQASSMQEIDNSTIEGDVLGVGGILHYKQLFFGAAYNYGFVDSGKQIVDGFGGGAYYTSLDEETIAVVSSNAIGEDIQAYRLGIGYEAVFVENLVVELIHGHLKSQNKTVNTNENDIVLTYQLNEALYFELIGAKYKQKESGEKFERFIMRIDYSF